MEKGVKYCTRVPSQNHSIYGCPDQRNIEPQVQTFKFKLQVLNYCTFSAQNVCGFFKKNSFFLTEFIINMWYFYLI